MTAPDLRRIAEIAPLVRAGDLSPVDLVRGCLAQIEARPAVNAFIAVLKESALQAAAVAEQDIRVGRYHGPLHGIPIAVKDLMTSPARGRRRDLPFRPTSRDRCARRQTPA